MTNDMADVKMKVKVKVKKLYPDATIPTKGTWDAAGWDLYALEDCIVPACEVIVKSWQPGIYFYLPIIGSARISTGIAFEIPVGYYGKIEARSGSSFKFDIETGAGVIDADYRGEIGVKLYNFSNKQFEIKKGQRIAQIIFQKHEEVLLIEDEELSETDRGENGFGHTGR